MGGIAILHVTHHNGACDTYELGDGPGMAPRWAVRVADGVPQLVIGRGLPRVHIPLSSVRCWLLEEHPDVERDVERERAMFAATRRTL